MNVGVVGCGYWGKNLVRNFSELGFLHAISDPNLVVATKMASRYGVPALTFDQLLSSDCDGIAIAAPATAHAMLAEAAFFAKKHVYVEKPLAMTLEEADRMIRAAHTAGRHLMVGHLLQYHPVFLRLREIIASGRLGNIDYISSTRLSPGRVRCEEDVLWSFAPHDISMVLSLAASRLVELDCEGFATLQPGIVDRAHLSLSFESGLQCDISCSWLHPEKEQKLVVVGTKGMAVFDDTLPWDHKLAIYEHEIDQSKIPPNLVKAPARYEPVVYAEPLKNECQYFVDLIAGRVPPRTDGYEGRQVLEVLAQASQNMKFRGKKDA